LKNIGSRVMGLVGYDVDFDGKYNIYFKFQGNISSSFKNMGQVHILLNTKFK
jgi:hypothetical protein